MTLGTDNWTARFSGRVPTVLTSTEQQTAPLSLKKPKKQPSEGDEDE